MKTSITPSTSTNVLWFEDAYNGSIFTLKCSKRQSPAAELLASNEAAGTEDYEEVLKLFSDISTSTYQDNVLYYFTGYCVRKVVRDLSCYACSQALIVPITSHAQSTQIHVVTRKNRGGLMEASDGAYRVIRDCENSFRVNVIFGSKIKFNHKKTD